VDVDAAAHAAREAAVTRQLAERAHGQARLRSSAPAAVAAPARSHPVLELQQTHGNRFVTGMLARQTATAEQRTEPSSAVSLLISGSLDALGWPVLAAIVRALPASGWREIFRSVTAERAAEILGIVARAGLVPVVLPVIGPIIITLPPERVHQIAKQLDRDLLETLVKSSRDFAQSIIVPKLDRAWPSGLGVEADASLGVTWGIPLYTGLFASFALSREDEGTGDKRKPVFKLKRRGEAREAADVGWGAGGFFGSGTKEGQSAKGRKGIGASAAADVEAGLKQIVYQVFRFPILEDNAFLSLLVTLSLSDLGPAFNVAKLLSDAVKPLDPANFHELTKIELKTYAEASAGAEAGLRTGTEETKPGVPQKWGREGAEETGRPEGFWQKRVLRGSVMARLAAESGVGFEFETPKDKWEVDPATGSRVPTEILLHASIEASGAAQLSASIPLLTLVLPQLPSVERGVGVKLTWVFNERNPNPSLTDPTSWTIYTETGADVEEFHTGAGSLAELKVKDVDPRRLTASKTAFLENIQEARLKLRFGAGGPVGTGFATRFLGAAMHGQSEMAAWIKRNQSADWAVIAEVYFDVEIKLDVEELTKLVTAVVTAAQKYSPGSAKNVLKDLETFVRTGKVPASIAREISEAEDLLYKHIERFKVYAALGFGAAAGAKVAAGAKARIHGSLAGKLTWEEDVIDTVKAVMSAHEFFNLLVEASSPTIAFIRFAQGELAPPGP
jgi:hypothetical protein